MNNTSLKNILKVLTVLYIDKKKNTPVNIQNMLKLLFKKVIYTENVDDTMKVYNTQKPDLIISEVYLNKKPVFPSLCEIRQYNHTIPMIVISADKEENILFEAIRLQLIDFIEKPIKMEKFIYVLNTTAKYILNHGDINVAFGNSCRYNYIQKSINTGQKTYQLTKNEFRLLELLLANEGKMITKEHIEYHIWGEEFVTESAFKSLVKRLRDKIGKETLKNRSGHGYYLNN